MKQLVSTLYDTIDMLQILIKQIPVKIPIELEIVDGFFHFCLIKQVWIMEIQTKSIRFLLDVASAVVSA